MKKIKFDSLERKWRKQWEQEGLYRTADSTKGKKNFYELVMFPYPSGNLHIGHWYNFAPADVVARYKKMRGYNVLHPIGFDAFGLPAENAAIKHGIHPEKWTKKNIQNMVGQLASIGTMYDWERMVITADPDYYRWTQWMFLKMFERGLAYRKKAMANWCPGCHTVLANEQVVEGKCDRCGSEVVQREIEQWLLKITEYAEKLLAGLDTIDWPQRTKAMQRNWIGKSEGSLIKFPIISDASDIRMQAEVFTTRADTLFGATYLVLAPEHTLARELSGVFVNKKDVEAYVRAAGRKTELQRMEEEKEKTGVRLEGVWAINPATQERIPVFIADYVLASYGTGAIMAVPAHDARDFAFAKAFKLPVIQVVSPNKESAGNEDMSLYEDEGFLINSGKFTGMETARARQEITRLVAGKQETKYRLRDWLVSRQRYWGSPIPLVYCEKCADKITSKNYAKGEFTKGELANPGWIGVREKDLPIELPRIQNYLPTDEGKSPLAHSAAFVKARCPKCGGAAQRETDTLDTFVCSSWYYLRYPDPKNKKAFADPKKLKAWLPVDLYIGGAEHATMHLLYARFFTKVLKDAGYLSFSEPFKALRHQGIILGPDNQKMSKSRGNVIDPDGLVKEFGADAVRMYLCFMGPYEQGGPWQPGGILGVSRFLQRVWALYNTPKPETKKVPAGLQAIYHQTVRKITEDIEGMSFNTAVSALMILLREMEAAPQLSAEIYEGFLRLLAPFAPYVSEEIYRNILGNKKSIFVSSWPVYSKAKARASSVSVVVQIGGKKRAVVEASEGATQEEVMKLIEKEEQLRMYLEGKQIIKVIYVPNKIINLILK